MQGRILRPFNGGLPRGGAVRERKRSILMRHLGDITMIHGAEIEPVDVVTGGSPCQDLSIAGKRAGAGPARSTSLRWR